VTAADFGRWNLAGHTQYRRIAGVGRAQRRCGIEHPGTRNAAINAYPAGRPRIAVCHVSRTLFVPRDDEADAIASLIECIDELVGMRARNTKNAVDAVVYQRGNNGLRAIHFLLHLIGILNDEIYVVDRAARRGRQSSGERTKQGSPRWMMLGQYGHRQLFWQEWPGRLHKDFTICAQRFIRMFELLLNTATFEYRPLYRAPRCEERADLRGNPREPAEGH
jgi:hypothetical protein